MSSTPLTRIAIVGASGRIGSAFARHLLQTGTHTVTALTRPGGASNASLPAGQFLVITLSFTAPRDVHARICSAAGKAGVKYIMPNAYGGVVDVEGEGENGYTQLKKARVAEVVANRRFLKGECVSVEGFVGKEVKISSFSVSQRDMLNSLNRVLGTTDGDWEISYESTEKRIRDGAAELKAGDIRGFAKEQYGHLFKPANKYSDFAVTLGTDNEVLGLAEENLDETTKRAVGMVESGWAPFGP
ncbi:hypothetical protein N0V88_005979 [Collariella sp. IMI 366227]|nr:hypothetical protein N0V88_005979 [Collariella sp. IMI 366227]